MQQIFPCSFYYGSIADSIFYKMVIYYAGKEQLSLFFH